MNFTIEELKAFAAGFATGLLLWGWVRLERSRDRVRAEAKAADHYTTDGGHLAPHPGMTDADLFEFERDMQVPKPTFIEWPATPGKSEAVVDVSSYVKGWNERGDMVEGERAHPKPRNAPPARNPPPPAVIIKPGRYVKFGIDGSVYDSDKPEGPFTPFHVETGTGDQVAAFMERRRERPARVEVLVEGVGVVTMSTYPAAFLTAARRELEAEGNENPRAMDIVDRAKAMALAARSQVTLRD